MVNMPMNLCAYATDKPNGFVTDINQNINQEYYEWLLKQHNYFPDCAFHKVSAKLCFSIDIDSEFFFLPVALNFRFIFRFILLWLNALLTHRCMGLPCNPSYRMQYAL